MAAMAAVLGIGAERFLRDRDEGKETPEETDATVPPAVPGDAPSGDTPESARSGVEALYAPAPSGRVGRLVPKPVDLVPVDVANPFAERAGVLTVGERKLQLAGIAPTDPAKTCANARGEQWPCGMVARTALRAFLRGRTLTCDLPGADWQGTVTARCRYVKLDISQWLVQNGWAEPEAGSPFAGMNDEARNARRGIYGDGPRKDGPSTLAPTPPKEDPLNPI